MKRKNTLKFKTIINILFNILVIILVWWVGFAGVLVSASPAEELGENVNVRGLPLIFIPNRGQVDDAVRFYTNAFRYTLWITDSGLVFDSGWNSRDRSIVEDGRDVSRLVFIGATEQPRLKGVETRNRVNYFRGSNPRSWHTDIAALKEVVYQGLYKDIDLKVYGIERQVAYEWLVQPGGEPGKICFQYQDVQGTRIDPDGSLVVETKFGEIMHLKPQGYQQIDGKQVNVPVSFYSKGKDTYSIQVESFHHSFALVIGSCIEVDSTYYGTGTDEIVEAMTVDGHGNIYICGTITSVEYPLINPYQSGRESFVSRIVISPEGEFYRDFTAILGGRLPWAGNDYGLAISVDRRGAIYIAGSTTSSDFPLVNAYQARRQGGEDAYVARLDPSRGGRDILTYSSYFGGFHDDTVYAVAGDDNGHLYMTGRTWSNNLPIRGGFQAKPGGRVSVYSDAFIARIDTHIAGESGFLYSSYLGGHYSDCGRHIAVDDRGHVYVSGITYGGFLPAKNGFQPNWAGNRGESYPDIFLIRVDTGKMWDESLLYATYLGGMATDVDGGLAVDKNGCVFLTGYTRSNDFPVRQACQSDLDWGQDAFVTKIDTGRSGDGSLIYSTFLGGEGNREAGTGITVDSLGNAYVTGHTESSGFPVMNPLYDASGGGNIDIFVSQLNVRGDDLLFSTYLGVSDNSLSCGIGLDAAGYLYVAGNSNCQMASTPGEISSKPVPGPRKTILSRIDKSFNQRYSRDITSKEAER